MCSLVSKLNELFLVGESTNKLETLLAELLPRSPRLLQITVTQVGVTGETLNQ